MKVDGACHCGQFRYEAEVDETRVLICNCTDCQTLSGTAFRIVVPTTVGGFRILSGHVSVYTKVADSGALREQAFCPSCGTPIFSSPPGETDKVVSLRIGSVRQRAQLVPKSQYWLRSALPWLADLSEIEGYETQPLFGPAGDFKV